MTRAPKRQRKGDRLINPDASALEVACDHAVAPLDRLATEYEMFWGIERLPALVAPEMAAKYGAAIAHLNACLGENDPAKVAAAANNCIRGLQAMDAAARAAGAQPASGDFWEYELEGDGKPFRFAVMRDSAEWQTAKAKRPDLQFYTMREVAVALKAFQARGLVAEVKDEFPNARITAIKTKPPVDYANGGDPIEF